jgi:hypothetical protein
VGRGSCNTPEGIVANKYLNIDLVTGKTVKLSRFVNDSRGVFAFEIGSAMARSSTRDSGGGFGDLWGRNTIAEWRGFRGWAATGSGVWVYFEWEGYVQPYLVRWERILKPGTATGKKVVSTARYTCSDTTYRLRVTVRGNLVKVVVPDQTVQYGVRGKSRTIVVHDAAGSLDGNGDMIRGILTFASAKSKRAISWQSLNYC